MSEISTKNDKKQARSWLKQIANPAKGWVKFTVLISVISGLLLIAQLYLLACIAYDAYILKLALSELTNYFLFILLIVILRAGLSWLREIVGYKAAVIVKKQLREDILIHIDKLGPVKSSQTSNANLITSAMEQVDGLTNYLTKFLPQVTLSAVMPMVILIFVFYQSIVAGIILLICMPLIPLFMIIVGLGAESESQKHFKELARMSLTFLDTLKGLTTLKLFNKSKSQSGKIFEASDTYRIRTMKVLKLAFLSSAVLELFSAASIALVAIYLGMGFINQGADNHIWWSLAGLNLQGALFILLLAPEFFMPLRELSTHYHAKADAVGAALEIAKIFEIEASQNENIALNDKVSQINIQNLTVKYNDKKALDDISFTIENNQKIAIVGASGAGKTTLINTLLGFIEYDGSVVIKVLPRLASQATPSALEGESVNIELKNIEEKSWLKNISWLGQNASLFKGSIKDNLLLAKPDASDEELYSAIAQANLDKFINSLPNKLDTQIGEQNIGLSGGQAQRLALARAYIKPHDLLILDEPTASLDKESETIVINSLKSSWQDKTVVMLTHKLSFLECVDQIIVLTNGKIVQQGTFDELVEQKDKEFYSFYKNEVVL
ncbi:cysteine/glutathione ABC transporter permease/ATP-binding protein CydD [Francisellaceae bacterium CB299]|jgi:ATP-binding cassette subfamily C protein CydD